MLAEALKREFLAPSRIVALEPGELLFSRGDTGDHVFLVLTGNVKTVNFGPDGDIVHFYEYGPDEVFGHYAVFAEAPRSASAVSANKATVLKIDSGQFVDFVLGRRELALALLKILATIARADTFRITTMLALPAPQRVASWLLYSQQTTGSATIRLENREDVASQLGMTRETLSRCLSRLQKLGAIDVAPHGVTLKDINLLMSESDYEDVS